MADENYIISITTEAAQALRAKDEIIAGLRAATTEAFRTGKAIGEQLGAGAREAARSAKAAQQEIDRGWKEVARTAAQAARTEATAQKQASRETAAAARQAAREQEEYARHVTMVVERAARERIAAEKAAYRETAKAARDAAQAQERSAREAQSAQRSARPSAGGGAGSQVLGGLGIPLGAAAGVGTALVAAKGFIALSDSYANLTSRLITLTGSEAAALPLREKLLKVAQDTKSANSSVVELYARIAGAVKELGVSEQQTLDFTERLTKSFKISGASTMAQEQAMIQLAQGLGAGALRGEEFNSVLEAAPNIIDIVGQHIGKTRGEMRAMAEQGALTTKTIIDAFEAAGPSIDEKFGKRIVTVGEQWVGFKNQLEVAVGEIGRSVNVSGLASEAFRSLGNAVKELAGLASGAIDLWKLWNDATGGLQGKLLKLSMSLENSPLFKYIDGVKTLSNYLGIGATLGSAFTVVLEKNNEIVRAGTAAIEARTRAQWESLDAMNREAARTNNGKKLIGFDYGLDDLDNDIALREKRAAEQKARWEAGLAAQAARRGRGVQRDMSELEDVLERTAGVADRFFETIRGGVGDGADLITTQIRESSEAAEKAAARYEILRSAVTGVQDGFSTGLAGFGASLGETMDGFAEAAESATETAVTFGDVMTEQFASVAVSGIDALVDSLNGGAQSFSDFARSALADLEKLLIKFLVFQAIKATLGTADGSFGGILSKSLGFAAGGSFTVPGAGSGGTDSVPVYFRATPGERVTVATPGQQAAQQGGSAPVVNVRPIIVNDQQAAMSEYLRTSDGERAIIAAVAKNPGLLRQAVAR